MKTLRQLIKDEQAATALEYALIVALISIVGIIATGLSGSQVNTSFSNIASTLGSANR
jgi:pilus assembly protein Flp/PilA